MINLKHLKVGNEYYIIDEDGLCEDVIIKFKVIHKLKGSRNKGHVEVQFLKYVTKGSEQDVKYADAEDNEIIIEKIYKDDEDRLFQINNFENANEYLQEVIEVHEAENLFLDMDNYIPPEEYPDWDGDESIMYLIDHYVEDEDDEDCDEDYEIICETCGNFILVSDNQGYYVCSNCGTEENI